MTVKTGRDLGLGEDWADVPFQDWTHEEEQELRQAEMAGQWKVPLMIKPPRGWSEDDWDSTLRKGLTELHHLQQEMRDRQARPWLYEPAKSDPVLIEILNRLDELNRENKGVPSQVALAGRARISVRQIERVLKRYEEYDGLRWRVIRHYRHSSRRA